MMEQKSDQSFENFLAQADLPTGVEGSPKVEPINDPSKSLALGLAKLYGKYLDQIKEQLAVNFIDENKATELTTKVDNLSLTDLGYEISKGLPVELAKEIMGHEMFFGPDDVKKAGIEIREEIQPIPFNPDELERAKELGQMLIYRTSTTMKELNDTLSPIFVTQNKGRVLWPAFWYEGEAFYTSDQIQPGWALVSKELNPGSTHKNYLEQSELLAEYLVNEVYQGKPLPQKYQEAVNQLNADKETIRRLIDSDILLEHQMAGQMLADLKINQLFRQSPAEIIYDCLVLFQNTGIRLLGGDYVWTNAQMPGGRMVAVGEFDEDGATVVQHNIFNFENDLGVSFSRRGTDLKL